MNKRQKEVQQAHLDEEKKIISQLERIYTKASADCDQKIRELASRTDVQNLQAIIYQKQYQEALKKQLDGVLDQLHGNSFDNIASYLGACYENGFVGSMYDLQGQGIPLIIPIDQRQVVKALQTDSKLSKSMYSRLGEDVSYLKKSIRAELSRGIANGSTWLEMASHIAKGMNSPFNKAKNNSIRIARTEGHRIQNQAHLDSIDKAKKNGADIVKQWDSTLDGRTRPEHREADGQIREIDEPFDVGGEKMDAPGVGGSARNVCNCRCCLLQRARWALDDDELKELENRAAYFGLDKTSDFADYKSKYMQACQAVQVQNGHPNCEIAKSFGADYYDEIHQRVVNCSNQTAAKVWDKYEDQIQVGDANYSGHEYCQGSKIYVNGARDAQGSSWQSPYQVTFHESGHAIDGLNRAKGNGVGWHFSATYECGKFPQTIKDEVSEWVASVDKRLKAEFKAHKDDYEWLHNNGFISDWKYDYYKKYGSWIGGTPKYAKSYAYSAVEKEVRGLSPKEKADLSDILEGATGGKISCGFGHGASYWKKRTVAGVADGLATEAFAEMMDSTFACPESLASIQKYLPKSYKVFEEMLDELEK